MAIAKLGNTNVYVIETNVPQPTDSRGQSYGSLVSDQRWRVWNEITKLTAAEMSAAGESDQELRKAFYQQQRLLQTELSNLRRERNSLVTSAVTKDAAAKAKAVASAAAEAAYGSEVETTTYEAYNKKVVDAFGDVVTLPQERRVVVKQKGRRPAAGAAEAPTEAPSAPGTAAPGTAAPGTAAPGPVREAIQPSLDEIDELITAKEAELDALKETPVGSVGPQKDLMTRVQERYAAQMGYGGYGLPKSARPLPNYASAASDIESIVLDAENAAERKYLAEIGDLSPLPEVVAQRRAEARTAAVDDLLKTFEPRPAAQLPIEGPKTVDAFGFEMPSRGAVTSPRPLRPAESLALAEERASSAVRDLISGRGSAEAPALSPTPSTFLPPASAGAATTVPTRTMSTAAAPAGVRDLSMSSDEIAARLAANELERQSIRPPAPQVQLPAFNERQAVFDMLGAPMPDVTSPASLPAPQVGPSLEDVQMQRQKDAFKNLQQKMKESAAPLAPGLPGAPETGAKLSLPARRDAYALAVVEAGAKLAAQPKRLERLAKTSLPQNERQKVVPQYVSIVDKLVETNAGKANAFKDTYDEISRYYSNTPDVRKSAHEYLMAQTILANNKLKPV